MITRIIILLLCIGSLSAQNASEINYTDSLGKKQGYWKLTSAMDRTVSCSDREQIVKEGRFKNSRKDGLWKAYYCGGVLQSKIQYANNRPRGKAVFYHENGNVKEEGEWISNRWVGAYKLYFPNGKVQQKFTFNSSGKREGKQEYYHENGQLMIEGNWTGGQKAGKVTEYYASGEVRSIKYFNGGKIDGSKTQSFEPQVPLPVVETPVVPTIEEKKATVVEPVKEKVNVGKPFNGEGYWKLYNRNKQVAKDGIFKNSRLKTGKVYYYDENGLLERIAIYKNGKYIGDGVLDEDAKLKH